MGWANSYRGHKTTLKCPIQGCKYHSRKFVASTYSDKFKNRISNSSNTCPFHRVLLVDVGGSKYSVQQLKEK